jgi:hypothetical protein
MAVHLTTHMNFFLSARGIGLFFFFFFVAKGGQGKFEGGENSMYYRNLIKIQSNPIFCFDYPYIHLRAFCSADYSRRDFAAHLQQ